MSGAVYPLCLSRNFTGIGMLRKKRNECDDYGKTLQKIIVSQIMIIEIIIVTNDNDNNNNDNDSNNDNNDWHGYRTILYHDLRCVCVCVCVCVSGLESVVILM